MLIATSFSGLTSHNVFMPKTHKSLLDNLEIPFVPKEKNPPNFLQLGPVELFWANLKSHVYKDRWEANNLRQLKQRITLKQKEHDVASCQALFQHVMGKIRKVADNGVFSVL